MYKTGPALQELPFPARALVEGGGRAEGEGSALGTTQGAGAWWQAAGRHIWAFRGWSGGC